MSMHRRSRICYTKGEGCRVSWSARHLPPPPHLMWWTQEASDLQRLWTACNKPKPHITNKFENFFFQSEYLQTKNIHNFPNQRKKSSQRSSELHKKGHALSEAWASRFFRSTLWTVIDSRHEFLALSSPEHKFRPPHHVPPGYPPPGYPPPYESWFAFGALCNRCHVILKNICYRIAQCLFQGLLWTAVHFWASVSLTESLASVAPRPGPDPFYGRPPPGHPPHYPPPHWRPPSVAVAAVATWISSGTKGRRLVPKPIHMVRLEGLQGLDLRKWKPFSLKLPSYVEKAKL